jgi:hypothetical protein
MSRRACKGSGKSSHTHRMPCFSVRILNNWPYQLLARMWEQPFPGQIMTIGDTFIVQASMRLNGSSPAAVRSEERGGRGGAGL